LTGKSSIAFAQRQSERRLSPTFQEAGESIFKELADNAPVMIWRSGVDGLCDWFNKPWLEFVGHTMEQELGDGWAEGVHPGDLDRCLDIYREAFKARESFTMVYRLRRADGAYRQILDTGKPFYRQGEFAGYFGSCIDVTAQQAAEAQLRQAQKMEAIGHITGGMAHDFNNLLHVIGVNLGLLARDLRRLGRDLDADGLVEKRLGNAMDAVSRGSKLASHLLAYARRRPLHPKVVNLGRLMLETDGILRDALGDAVELQTLVSPGLWNTRIDPVQFETALLNLAINARDAMEGRGTFRIELQDLDLDADAAAALGNVKAGQYVLVSATDTGCGMSPQTIERAFDPFFTTKGEGSGTGLGLSTIQGFIDQSGGHIRLESELGRGTTVRIYLPRSLDLEEVEGAQVESPRVRGGTATILLVEDDDHVRAVTAEMLAELGYVVQEARDADSAMAAVESGARLDLLFIDVMMPGAMKSTELVRRALERLPGLGVLYTSGHGYNELVDRGELDEGVKLLSKPYTREELSQRLARILAQNGSLNAQV
jgi:PAS domain S-box-containing protein